MSRYYPDDRSGTPLAGVSAIAFLILAGVTGTAFFAVSEGVFEAAPAARLHAFPQEETKPAAMSTAPNPLPHSNSSMPATVAGLDPLVTTAMEPEVTDAPACDIEACMAAYRSFRVLDCTFQPYDGPRRLCTR